MMKDCFKCGIAGDEASFHPNQLANPRGWCKLCVDTHCGRKTKVQRTRIDKIEREQTAVRCLVKQLQAEDTSFVYLLEGPGGYKIGFSTNVAERIRALNTSFSETCKLIAVAPGGRQLERELHHKFRYQRLNREWFAQAPRILNGFKELDGVVIFLPGYLTEELPQATPSASDVKSIVL